MQFFVADYFGRVTFNICLQSLRWKELILFV